MARRCARSLAAPALIQPPSLLLSSWGESTGHVLAPPPRRFLAGSATVPCVEHCPVLFRGKRVSTPTPRSFQRFFSSFSRPIRIPIMRSWLGRFVSEIFLVECRKFDVSPVSFVILAYDKKACRYILQCGVRVVTD